MYLDVWACLGTSGYVWACQDIFGRGVCLAVLHGRLSLAIDMVWLHVWRAHILTYLLTYAQRSLAAGVGGLAWLLCKDAQLGGWPPRHRVGGAEGGLALPMQKTPITRSQGMHVLSGAIYWAAAPQFIYYSFIIK